MRFRYRVAAVSASLALAGGGAVGVAAPASASEGAAPSLSCDAWRYERGSDGHGASITCYGSSFTGYAVCHQPDGYLYLRFGNRARSGGTSTVWCGRNAEVTDAGAIRS
ncbi:hypothetical protein J1792_24435 [Streptomyces triculaminicus]|uniref:Uncharacterized protein n=2 Tax=Streptomyces TaxID=1883 RepID=A0A939JSF9_9ACTN|nr:MULTISPECIES: hypothetical protein [Streptomyces]MBO0655812.1 hypothetical protein [Streptomyces triculaminicus]QSY49830.1 hypothetical protein J3S04_01585 [Streptomyces griseocarneus]